MKTWVNYHSHTHFCDGTTRPEDYIQAAIELGHPAYGFSSHAPVPFTTDWNIPGHKFQNYLDEIDRLKALYSGQIEIYKGLEIDYIPGLAGRSKYLQENATLDYFIGSVHFVDVLPDGKFWNIDTSADLFARGLKEIFADDIREAASRFWEITREMVTTDKPDVIGHLDKIKMFNKENRYFSEKEDWYVEQVENTLGVIKEQGCIVEINTRGLYRYGQTDLYPGAWIIRRIAEMGIPVMINSDAHKPEEIELGMDYTAAILLSHKIDSVSLLYHGGWKSYPLSPGGIEFPD